MYTFKYTYMENKQETEVQQIFRIKLLLEQIPFDLRSRQYTEILDKCRFFLFKHCQHIYVFDYIELGVENGCNICYCDKCETTFEPQDYKPIEAISVSFPK